ncbi:MAG: ABC transporter ATP-binding protein [Candidatus Schekmanbacteria bacterium]|nr:ABC transporter ATP-binding protein [Candidatus Schekmanbacteria bacterium]
MEPLLKIENLKTYFYKGSTVIKAADGVNISVNKGEVHGVVGESGCGKSVTAMSILRLVPTPPGKIIDGKIIFDGQDLLQLPEKEMRNIRGNRISIVFQEPMTYLNPVFTIGNQISETLLVHRKITKHDAIDATVEILKKIGMPAPEQRIKEYPHQLSGGMRQRVLIAMALICGPDLLIADEPTTALDVTIQAQIIDLIMNLQKDSGMSVMLITHDFGVVAESCQKVSVMYGGKVVESTDVFTIFEKPLHPYTAGLLRSVRSGDADAGTRRLTAISGIVPNPAYLPEGCKFNPRCPLADERCRETDPDFIEKDPGHFVRCWKSDKAPFTF